MRFGDRWVLIISLWRRTAARFALAGVRYLVGALVVGPDGPRFTPASGGQLDRGPCFYAPQVLRVGGRVLLWAWSWERGRARPDPLHIGLDVDAQCAVVDGDGQVAGLVTRGD